jgi:hypothetical protein
MDIQRGQRAFLAEAIDANVGVLQRGDRTDRQLSKMEIVPAADEGAPFRAFRAAIGQASQTGAARIIVIVPAVDGAVNVDSGWSELMRWGALSRTRSQS